MPSRQSSLLNHFSPSNRRNAKAGPGPSSSRSGTATRQTRATASITGAATGSRRHERQQLDSESEGSDAMDAIGLGPSAGVDVDKLPMTQRRAIKKTVYDSDDDNDEDEDQRDGGGQKEVTDVPESEEEDAEDVEEVIRPTRVMKTVRRANGRRLRRGVVEDNEPDGDGPSIILDWYDSSDNTPPFYHEDRKARIASKKAQQAALERRRDKQREDDKVYDDIEVFPSPPSPPTTRGKRTINSRAQVKAKTILPKEETTTAKRRRSSTGSIIVLEESLEKPKSDSKGKERAKKVKEDADEDDIVPIDPPAQSQRARRTPSKRSTHLVKSTATGADTKPAAQVSTRAPSKGRALNFRRTTSELEIHLPKLSQEERASYIKWIPTVSSESIVEREESPGGKTPSAMKPAEAEVEAGAPVDGPSASGQPAVDALDVETSAAKKPTDPEDRQDSPALPTGPTSADADMNISAIDVTEQVSQHQPSPQPPSPRSTSPQQYTPAHPSPATHPPTSARPPVRSSPAQAGPPSPPAQPIVETAISDADLDFLTEHERSLEEIKSPVIATKPSAPARKRALPSPTPSSSSSPVAAVSGKRKDKGTQKAVRDPDEDSDSDAVILRPSTKKPKVNPGSISTKSFASKASKNGHATKTPKKGETPKKKGHLGKLKSKARDPDDEDDVITEDEDDMIEQLKMDEPERFKSKTRLREKKESAFQRKIRLLKARREGRVQSTSESEQDEDDDNTTSDSAVSSGEEDFIVADDSMVEAVQLPHMFSIDSAQTPEFKFKVVFHYLVLLVVKGKKALPLSPEAAEYFRPQLHYWRDRMTGFRNFRVRSQIWRSNIVKAMEKYPLFEVEELTFAEPGCDACHMGGRMSRFRVNLDGEEYDKETHVSLDTSDEGSESSADTDDSEAKANRLPRSLLMGRFCRARAQVFHQLTHWEDELYYRIRSYYRDLLRAKYKPIESDSEQSSSSDNSDSDPEEVAERRRKRKERRVQTAERVEKLRKKVLPNDYKDVDKVTEWMDRMGYQTKFRWIQQLENSSERLEHDKQKDE